MRDSRSPFCAALSVPVRSVTRALSGGTGTSARAGSSARMPASAIHPASRSRRMRGYCFCAGLPKSTFGGAAIAFSFSTEKLAFAL